MDEKQSDLRNNTIGRIEENVKKKKKRRKKRKKNMNLHELTESSKVQTEKHNEKKQKKNIGELENTSLQTPTGKKKKRKLNEGGEIVVSGEASMDGGVTSLHQVRNMKVPTGSIEGKPAKAKKRRTNVTKTNCDDLAQEEQSVMTPEPEEVLYMSKESGFPALPTGTKKHDRKKKLLEEALVDTNPLNELKEYCPKIESRQPDDINKMIVYDLPRFREFKKKGRLIILNKYIKYWTNITNWSNIFDKL